MEPLWGPVRNKSLIPEYVWLQSQLGPDLIPGHHLEAITLAVRSTRAHQ
jgi:hypothetical protein